jgi:hypothetical protein
MVLVIAAGCACVAGRQELLHHEKAGIGMRLAKLRSVLSEEPNPGEVADVQ